MRKLPAAIPVSAMFLILAVLLVFMCLPLGQMAVDAVGGALDLRGETMDEYVYALQGQWQFIYGELLIPEDFAREVSKTKIIELPSAWEDSGHSLNGCATYRLTIQTDDTNPLMLYVPEISSAYALWVNGALVQSAGVVSDNPSEGRPLFENALIPVQAKNGVVELVIQVSNYHFMQSSLTLPLLFGETGSILVRFFRTRALYCVALGCVLMAAFYHLALYIFRRREKVYLIFALMCVLCFTRFLTETNGINQYLQWIPLNMFGIRLFVVLLFLHTASVIVFSLYVFDRGFLSRRKTWVAALTALGVALFCVMPLNASWSLGASSLILLPFLLFTVVMAARSPVLRRDKWTRLYFAALLLYISWGTVAKLFFENLLYMPGLLVNMFMIMAQSLVLSRSYADAFKLVEETNENLERIVDERTKDLRHINEAMRELINNISHDLKTPLAIMSVNLEKLADPSKLLNEEQYRQSAGVAYHKSLDLQRITQKMFDVTRIKSGQSLYNPEWVPLPGLLSRVQEKYAGYMDSEGLTFDVVSAAASRKDADAEIYIDQQHIWSIFDNIIYNAVRHTKTGGVSVTATPHGESMDVTVTDTGEGIAPEHLPHIFERFYKASRERGGGDSGVGLHIVRSVMEGMGGSVRAESEPGRGTSIILEFKRKGL